MTTASLPEEEIFQAARRIDLPEARKAYLDDICHADAPLREQVEALLAAHDASHSFLESPAPELGPTIDRQVTEQPGTAIGPYKLLEQIGEGGFGVVFQAEQERPVKRRVALKVIKPGMDTREVIARFEAERQALAMMDHPNIAKVHDAGATENGRPYFVMELVQGVPITEYCDQCNLTTMERLELFVLVCRAVQHAHHKGVIHRDIKPTNVLVAMQDGKPAPKIIDFGVAKAMGQRLTEHTLTTAFAQMVGSPLYMSPEQAELSPLGVDTRSDIYSLGVMLYELLAGTTPFDKERLNSASYDELRRIIREEEPPRPSTRISTLAANLATTVAEHRRTDARRLSQQVRGELDWIVMKCLEKDRNRRYESAGGLALDIGRYLRDEPVEACPPSARYRFSKFARRNKLSLQAAGLVALALVVGMAVSTWQAVRATRSEVKAISAQAEAHQAINDYFLIVSEDEALRHEPALQPLRRKLLETALAYYERFVREDNKTPQLRAEMAATCSRIAILNFELGTGEDWFVWLDKSTTIIEELLEEQHDLSQFASLTAGNRWLSGAVAVQFVDPNETYPILERSCRVAEEIVRRHPVVPGFQNDLATFYFGMSGFYKFKDMKQALALSTKSQQIWEKLIREHPDVPEYRAALATNLTCTAASRVRLRQPGAEQQIARALTLARELVQQFPDVPSYHDLLGSMHEERGFLLEHADHFGEAERAYRDMLDCYEELRRDHPTAAPYQQAVFRARLWLGEVLWNNGDADSRRQGKEQFKQAFDIAEQTATRDPFVQYLFAWFLANVADPEMRDSLRAAKLAQNLVEQVEGFGDCWIALGIARYRAGDYQAAVEAFEIGTRLPTHYDSCPAQFFWAMAQWHLGQKDEALRHYRAGVAQMNKEYEMLEFRRVRDEAAKLLGVPLTKNSTALAEIELSPTANADGNQPPLTIED